MRAAILGCGSGGLTMAVDLGLRGFQVKLYDFPEFAANLRAVEERGYVEAHGEIEGRVEPEVVDSIAEAVEGVDIIFLTIRAYGAERFIGEASRHMEPGQIILNWASYFSALRCYGLFREGAPEDAILAEGAILPYFAKPLEPGVMWVYAVKQHLWASAMPSRDNPQLMRVLREFFPNCQPMRDVLETSLTNPNLQPHVPPTLLNVGAWERCGGDLDFYGSLITPSVAAVMEAVDRERIAVGAALGLRLMPKPEVLKLEYGRYGVRGESMYEVYQTLKSHRGWRPRMTLKEFAQRTAFGEDLLYGYVPISSLGDQLGVETPTMDALVNLASIVVGRDFWSEGITVRELGLEGLSAEEMIRYVAEGSPR